MMFAKDFSRVLRQWLSAGYSTPLARSFYAALADPNSLIALLLTYRKAQSHA